MSRNISLIIDSCVPTLYLKYTAEALRIMKIPWQCIKFRRFRRMKDKAWQVFDCTPTHDNLRKVMDAQHSFESIESETKKKY